MVEARRIVLARRIAFGCIGIALNFAAVGNLHARTATQPKSAAVPLSKPEPAATHPECLRYLPDAALVVSVPCVTTTEPTPSASFEVPSQALAAGPHPGAPSLSAARKPTVASVPTADASPQRPARTKLASRARCFGISERGQLEPLSDEEMEVLREGCR